MRKRSCGRPLRCSPSALLGVRPSRWPLAADPDTTALRNAVTRAEVLRYEQRLNAIGLSNENNRLTASQGNFESLNYVIDELRKIGYNPTLLPYANAQHPNTWSERTPSVLEPIAEPIAPTPKTYVNGTWAHERLRADDLEPHRRLHRAGDPGRAGSQIPPRPRPATRQPRRLLDERLPGRGQGQHRARAARRLHRARREGDQRPRRRREGRHDHERGPDRLAPPRRATSIGTTFTRGTRRTRACRRDALLRRRPGALRRSPRPARRRRCTSRPTTTSRSGSTTTSSPRRPAAIRPASCMVGAHIDGVAAGPGINDDGSGTAMNLTIAHQILKLGIAAQVQDPLRLVLGRGAGPVRLDVLRQPAQLAADGRRPWRMLDYDMIASTNWIPFMYVPNPSETALPPVQRRHEAIAERHPHRLPQAAAQRHDSIALPVRQPLRLRRRCAAPAASPRPASTPAPRASRPCTGRRTTQRRRPVRRPGRHPGRPVLPRVVRHGVQPEPVRPGRVHRRARARVALVRRRRHRRGRAPGPRTSRSGGPGGSPGPRAAGRAYAASSPRSSARAHGLGAVAHAELAEDRGGVLLDGVGGEPERRARSRGWWPRSASAVSTSRSRGETGSGAGARRPRARSTRGRVRRRSRSAVHHWRRRARRAARGDLVVAHQQRRTLAGRSCSSAIAASAIRRSRSRGQRVRGVARTHGRAAAARAAAPARRTSSASATSTRSAHRRCAAKVLDATVGEHAEAARGVDGRGAVGRAELLVEPEHVVLDRPGGEVQRRADLGVGQPGADEPQDLALARGEAHRRPARAAAARSAPPAASARTAREQRAGGPVLGDHAARAGRAGRAQRDEVPARGQQRGVGDARRAARTAAARIRRRGRRRRARRRTRSPRQRSASSALAASAALDPRTRVSSQRKPAAQHLMIFDHQDPHRRDGRGGHPSRCNPPRPASDPPCLTDASIPNPSGAQRQATSRGDFSTAMSV